VNALEVVASSVARPFVGRARRHAIGIGLNEALANMFSSGQLPLLLQQTLRGEREEIETSFAGYVGGLYLRNPVVFACLALRARLFSEIRFAFQQLRNGRPGQLFGTADLRILEDPEPGKTTGDLLSSLQLDADLAGDGFVLRRPDRLRRLRPDWTIIAYGARVDRGYGGWDPDAEVIGYGHTPGGLGSGNDALTFLPEEIGHYAPTRDPLARNRGISLLTAGLREISADSSATTHKLAYFQNAATSNLLVTFPPELGKEAAEEWIELFEEEHRGALNAYKALYIGGGPQAQTIGSNMEQATFSELQGKAETRIAALTGMHPVVAALSEGLGGSSLNAGNFAQAARLVADATLATLWRNVAGSLQPVVNRPPGARLWYDVRDVPFLRNDVKDQAEIISKDASSITGLTKEGFTAASAIDAVVSGDMTRLVHTGLVSVQLQAPGTTVPPAAYRVRQDFWALEYPYAGLGALAAGTEVPADHPIVTAFPALLEPIGEDRSQLVTTVQVHEVRRRLLADGRDAGYDSIARELGVSRDTVRRRLRVS